VIRGWNFAFIGLSPNNGCQNINDIPGAVALVKTARREDPTTLVIVSMHGGAEGSAYMAVPDGPEVFMGENRGDLRRLSRALIDAGAAMIILNSSVRTAKTKKTINHRGTETQRKPEIS
jgi:hypothetical protein